MLVAPLGWRKPSGQPASARRVSCSIATAWSASRVWRWTAAGSRSAVPSIMPTANRSWSGSTTSHWGTPARRVSCAPRCRRADPGELQRQQPRPVEPVRPPRAGRLHAGGAGQGRSRPAVGGRPAVRSGDARPRTHTVRRVGPGAERWPRGAPGTNQRARRGGPLHGRRRARGTRAAPAHDTDRRCGSVAARVQRLGHDPGRGSLVLSGTYDDRAPDRRFREPPTSAVSACATRRPRRGCCRG